MLDAIYTSPLLGQGDKTVTRILAETQAILGAGTETTGNTLSVLTYHVLSEPSIHRRLRRELRDAEVGYSADNTLLDYRMLEKLPYLQACIKEALRLATGVSSRLPRTHRTAPVSYTDPSGKKYTFPPGTVISMSILDLHYNDSIFPAARSFKPERWLEADGDTLRQMERGFVPVSRPQRRMLTPLPAQC